MWGDYHARELALYLLRVAESRPYSGSTCAKLHPVLTFIYNASGE